MCSTSPTVIFLLSIATAGQPSSCSYLTLCCRGGASVCTPPSGSHPCLCCSPPSLSAEVGHNFGAIHAFDYCGKDGWGDNQPVDYCKQTDNGCSQPNGYGFVPKCSSTPSAFGGGGGTIMSYCDEIGPGYIRNVAMTFGKNHPCECLAQGLRMVHVSVYIAHTAAAA